MLGRPLARSTSYFLPDSIILPLPGYDTNGRKIILTRPGLEYPYSTSLEDVTKACVMVMDVWLLEDEQNSVTAVVMVEDFKTMTLAHLAAFTPAMANKISTMFQVLVRYGIKG